jgi:hypothetical protein
VWVKDFWLTRKRRGELGRDEQFSRCSCYHVPTHFWHLSFYHIGSAPLSIVYPDYNMLYNISVKWVRDRAMVFNAIFNTIPVISWRSVLLVKKIGVPGENHRTTASHWQPLSHNVVSSRPHREPDLNSQL